MGTNIRGRNFLALEDFTPDELRYVLDLAHELKAQKKTGVDQHMFGGKNLLMLFEMGSTRTRCAFETSANDLGMGTTYLANSHFGAKETIEDSMLVFTGMYDAIVYRGENHRQLLDMAESCGIPLINGFTTYEHPTQMLADFMTLEEVWGRNGFRGKTFCFVGNGQNGVALSYAVMCALMGMNFRFVGPEDSSMSPDEVKLVETLYATYNPQYGMELTTDIEKVKGADVLSTENWGDFTAPVETWIPGIAKYRPYQINAQLIEKVQNPDVFVLHMLPASHNCEHSAGADLMKMLDPETAAFISKGLEVTDEVFKANKSFIFREAENRQHTIKAVLVAVIGE